MKNFWTILGMATIGLYLIGFLNFGSWESAGISIGLIAVFAAGIGIAQARETARFRKQARTSGRSVTEHRHNGIRVFHPDGTDTFHGYK